MLNITDKNGNFVEDNGGRDVTLLETIGHKANFQFSAMDPLEFGAKRTRGSSWKEGFKFNGILGKIHRREEPFHM